jgi:hypothetical protein
MTVKSIVSDVHISKVSGNNENDAEMIKVQGRLLQRADEDRLFYFAASPAERRQSFSGSGLPFLNADQAFHASPNVGSMSVKQNGRFEVEIACPNAYYVGLGTQYVSPTLHVWYMLNGERKDASIKVNNGIPFRTLTYPSLPTRPRDGPEFYLAAPTLVRSQEQILRDSAYPSKQAVHSADYSMPDNFWGLKPPY